jgi:predicted SprT family Zn-dependent metalloprotease
MATAPKRRSRSNIPQPPPRQDSVIIHGDQEVLQHWLDHYWCKLALPEQELCLLAITQDRQEFMRWTGKRLDLMILGCYCYIPAPGPQRSLMLLQTGEKAPHITHRHLIFIEPDMQPRSIEVTVAHELIHLADRVNGKPRRHHHHGYDAIAVDEAAVTGYAIEDLRALLHEESVKREQMRRARRPIRYLYECPHCGKKYPRTRKYSHAVSCSSCDKRYNPYFRLQLSQAE